MSVSALEGALTKRASARHLRAVTAALNAHDNPLVAVVRHGPGADATLVTTLRSGAELRFEHQGDVLKPEVVMTQTALAGLPVPLLTKKNWLPVVHELMAAATLLEDESRHDELVSRSRSFLFSVLGANHTLETFQGNDLASRYYALGLMQNHRAAYDGYTPVVALSIVLIDTDSGVRWLRLTDYRRWWQEEEGRMSWERARSIGREIGWRVPGELKQRRPAAVMHGPQFHRVNPILVPAGMGGRR